MYKSSNGFSLVSALVSIVILSVGFLSVAKLQTSMIRANTLSKERSAALAFAQDAIENARISVTMSTDASQLKQLIDSNIEDNERDTTTATLSREINTTTLDNGSVEIQVTVSWPGDRNGYEASDATTIYLSSIISINKQSRAIGLKNNQCG